MKYPLADDIGTIFARLDFGQDGRPRAEGAAFFFSLPRMNGAGD